MNTTNNTNAEKLTMLTVSLFTRLSSLNSIAIELNSISIIAYFITYCIV